MVRLAIGYISDGIRSFKKNVRVYAERLRRTIGMANRAFHTMFFRELLHIL